MYVANIWDQKDSKQQAGIQRLEAKTIDNEYLNALGLNEKLDSWREICAQAEQGEK